MLMIAAGSWICQVNGVLDGPGKDNPPANEKIVKLSPQQASFGAASNPELQKVDKIIPPVAEEKANSIAVPERSVCETFEVHYVKNKKGKTIQKFKRNRKSWGREDRARFKQLIHLVTSEMNADPRMFEAWGLRESTLNPSAIHLLNADLEAATTAWQAHKYSQDREQELVALMDEVGARDRRFWKAKAELYKIRKFMNNAYFDDRITFVVKTPTETLTDTRSSWSYGYGAFGMNPTLFLHIWDPEAPPWVFCAHDGIPAIVTAIWAARSQKAECQSLGYEGSYRVVNRRYGTGHCEKRQSLKGRGKVIKNYSEKTNLNLDDDAKLGCRTVWKKGKKKKVKECKWDEETTDRYEIVEYMTKQAQTKGIL